MTAPLVTDAGRSALMRRVRRARTAPEETVARALRAAGIAYRRNARGLPGTPDFANRRRGFAIFVHGCFWHRHPDCPRATTPKSNAAFWNAKFAANVARDAAKTRALTAQGFAVHVIWECETEKHHALEAAVARIGGGGAR
jgi:DNA mismatch endonuclease, patch repair protein